MTDRTRRDIDSNLPRARGGEMDIFDGERRSKASAHGGFHARQDTPVSTTKIVIGDDEASWRAAGFTVAGGACRIGTTTLQFDPSAGRGIVGASLGETIDGLADVALATEGQPGEIFADHANGITAIDHLVVMTPNCDRTTEAFEAAGYEVRRVRRFDVGDRTQRQTFFWWGPPDGDRVIIELVGPDLPDGEDPAVFWGLALTSPDLDATVASLGDLCLPAKTAVQKGRRIATIKTRDLDISVPIAVLSEHVG